MATPMQVSQTSSPRTTACVLARSGLFCVFCIIYVGGVDNSSSELDDRLYFNDRLERVGVGGKGARWGVNCVVCMQQIYSYLKGMLRYCGFELGILCVCVGASSWLIIGGIFRDRVDNKTSEDANVRACGVKWKVESRGVYFRAVPR